MYPNAPAAPRAAPNAPLARVAHTRALTHTRTLHFFIHHVCQVARAAHGCISVMKFKTTLHGEGLSLLKNVVQLFAGLSHTCTLAMEPDALRLASISQKSSLRVYGCLRSALISKAYKVKSNAANVINVEVNSRSLLSALRSAEASSPDATVVKLTMRQGTACLTFEIREITGTCTITQDVPVLVLTAEQAEADREPRAPPPQVQLELTDCRSMLKVVETLRTVDPQLRIRADNNGTLTIGVSSPMATMRTFYHGLKVRGASLAARRRATSSVIVDSATFRAILQCSAASPISTLCCIANDSSLVFNVALGHGGATLTYYAAVQPAERDDVDEGGDEVEEADGAHGHRECR